MGVGHGDGEEDLELGAGAQRGARAHRREVLPGRGGGVREAQEQEGLLRGAGGEVAEAGDFGEGGLPDLALDGCEEGELALGYELPVGLLCHFGGVAVGGYGEGGFELREGEEPVEFEARGPDLCAGDLDAFAGLYGVEPKGTDLGGGGVVIVALLVGQQVGLCRVEAELVVCFVEGVALARWERREEDEERATEYNQSGG